MLTEAEKKWLEERKPPTEKPWRTIADDNFCKHCKQYDIDCVPWFRNTGDCPTHRGGDYRDATEFEARVQKKLLLLWSGGKAKCPYKHCCAVFVAKKHWTDADRANVCGWCMQRFARLAVEAEMEKGK